MLKLGGFFCLLFCGLQVYAQESGWNWPEDPGIKKLAIEKQAYYKVQMQLDNYPGALNTLRWLYAHAPDLNESIYIDGAKIIDRIMDGKLKKERKALLEDSVLWMYDMRIRHFDNDETVIDRKAYGAFKLYYKTPEKFPLLLELYEDLYALEARHISDFNLTPYMTLAKYYHQANPEEMSSEKVLDIHATITEVIDTKIGNGGDADKMKREQDKIDALLSSMGNILSCEFIGERLAPKFKANPEDLNLAKKLFSYSVKIKCTNEPYFLAAAERLYDHQPSYPLAKNIGDRHYNQEDYENALTYYQKAKELTDDPAQKAEALMGIARIHSKLDNKPRARAAAYEVLSVQPDIREAYNLIGNLYYTSFQECRQGESKVKDRAAFLAAYEMYKKAGNTDQMKASKEQFPSIEEIFTENYEEGDKITVDCWINETVVIQRR